MIFPTGKDPPKGEMIEEYVRQDPEMGRRQGQQPGERGKTKQAQKGPQRTENGEKHHGGENQQKKS